MMFKLVSDLWCTSVCANVTFNHGALKQKITHDMNEFFEFQPHRKCI